MMMMIAMQAQLKIDKESVRNILIMHKSVEKALDHKRLMILPEGAAEYKVQGQCALLLGWLATLAS